MFVFGAAKHAGIAFQLAEEELSDDETEMLDVEAIKTLAKAEAKAARAAMGQEDPEESEPTAMVRVAVPAAVLPRTPPPPPFSPLFP